MGQELRQGSNPLLQSPGVQALRERFGARVHLPAEGFIRDWLTSVEDALLIEDLTPLIAADAGDMIARATGAGARAAAVLPLQVGERWVGMLIVSWPAPRAFPGHDRQIYTSIASQVAVALSNQQLSEQARARARQLELLSRMEADLSLASTEDEILLALANDAPWEDEPALDLVYLSSRPSDGARRR